MAIAPLNKFITVAVPVAPGKQTVYTTPTGVTAILLYAQVSNVGVNTYPTISLFHERKSNSLRTVGNTRKTRIVKDIEIPPNDAVVLIDGRLILEKTAIISDSIFIEGSQSGIVTIKDCVYDHNTGITTITTWENHNFNVNDEVTMSGLAFTCSGSFGLTTSIFPSPQRSFTLNSIVDSVGTSKTFVTNSGIVIGIAHTYVSGGSVGPLQMEFICSILENSTS
jgi:hypothetical protein